MEAREQGPDPQRPERARGVLGRDGREQQAPVVPDLSGRASRCDHHERAEARVADDAERDVDAVHHRLDEHLDLRVAGLDGEGLDRGPDVVDVGESRADQSAVGAVPDRRVGHADRDRQPDLDRCGRRGGRAARDETGGGQVVRREQSGRIGGAEPAVRIGTVMVGDPPAYDGEPVGGGDGSGGPRRAQPGGVPHGVGERAHRRVDRRQHRHAGDRVAVEAAEEHRDHGLVRVGAPGLGHGGQHRRRVEGAGGRGDDQQGVDVVVGEEARAGLAQVLGGAGAGRPGRHLEPVPDGSVGGQVVEPAGVAEDREARTGGQCLLGEQQGGLGQLVRVAAGDHPGLGEQRVDAHRERGGGRCAGRAGGLAACRATAHHGEERLGLGEPPPDPGELRGVAEGLEVERCRRHVGVVDPGREQVVAGDVGLVAQRHEVADPEPEAVGDVEHEEADTAGLRGDGEPTRQGAGAGQGGGEAEVGLVVDEAQAVGPDDPDPAGAGGDDEGALEVPALVAALGEAGGEHDGSAGTRVGRGLEAADHLLGRYGDDDEVDRTRGVGERGVRRDAGDRGCLRVDDDEVAEVAALDDGLHDRGTDPGPVPAGTDDRDPLRPQQRRQRGSLGVRLAGVRGAQGALRGLGGHLHGDDAAVELAGHLEAGVLEHAHHRGVLGQHVGGEADHAHRAGGRREVLEEQGADAVAAERVGDQERDLGLVVQPLGRGEPHQALVLPQAQRQDLAGVVLGQEVVDVGVPGLTAGAEEAQPQALQAHFVVQGEERVAVVEAEPADHRQRAVGQQHVSGRRLRDGRGRRAGRVSARRRAAGAHGSSLASSSGAAARRGRVFVPGPLGPRPLPARGAVPSAGGDRFPGCEGGRTHAGARRDDDQGRDGVAAGTGQGGHPAARRAPDHRDAGGRRRGPAGRGRQRGRRAPRRADAGPAYPRDPGQGRGAYRDPHRGRRDDPPADERHRRCRPVRRRVGAGRHRDQEPPCRRGRSGGRHGQSPRRDRGPRQA